ncbi:MAG: TOBE domain-containing protein [Campylobacterota bacterium]|nr:TOBE domain-containing protein [Campylobacterota bacterium]
MSKIKAVITEIQSVDSLNIVTFDFNGRVLKMMSLGLGSDVSVGKEVILGINPTHIALAKDFSGLLSYSNQVRSTIISCDHGTLLSSIKLSAEETLFESIITLESALSMDLKVGDEVSMMMKASELSILELL